MSRLNGDFIDAGEKVTIYGYGPNDSGTKQTSKQVYEARALKPLTTNSYDLQGRLQTGTVESFDAVGVNVAWRETTSYDASLVTAPAACRSSAGHTQPGIADDVMKLDRRVRAPGANYERRVTTGL